MKVDGNAVFSAIQEGGPQVPAEISSKLGSNTILVGAILSDLVRTRKVFMTSAKWGGSVLYYAPEHKPQITRLYQKLNEKDKQAYELLEQKKVLQDDALTPLERTCMRSLKDFAIPIQVKFNGTQTLYWKWFLTTDEEAKVVLQQLIKPTVTKVEPPKVEEKQEETQKEPQKDETMHVSQPQRTYVPQQAQQTLISATLEEPQGDEYYQKVKQFLQQKQIAIHSVEVVKKNGEFDMVVTIPTPVGQALYYLKAKKKKKSNDADLATAFVKGQLLHLPICYLSDGELTKKAEKLLETDYKNVLVVTM